MRKILSQLSWFVVVGCAAAATHWVVVVAVVSLASLAPLAANVIGWLVALVVSF
jgi:putative flippase GtrA